MTWFIARVELHGLPLDHEIYDELHQRMEAAGFERFISDDDGKLYKLPSAEYFLNSPSFREPGDVLDLVHELADYFHHRYSAMVSKTADIAFNLTRYRPSA